MPSLAELMKQKLKYQEELKKQPKKEIAPELEKISSLVKKPKQQKKVKKSEEILIKTDYFRTGISLITGSGKRDPPPIMKRKLTDFLNNHELVKKENTWYWVKIS